MIFESVDVGEVEGAIAVDLLVFLRFAGGPGRLMMFLMRERWCKIDKVLDLNRTSRSVSRYQSRELVEIFLDGCGRSSDILLTVLRKRRYGRPLLFNL